MLKICSKLSSISSFVIDMSKNKCHHDAQYAFVTRLVIWKSPNQTGKNNNICQKFQARISTPIVYFYNKANTTISSELKLLPILLHYYNFFESAIIIIHQLCLKIQNIYIPTPSQEQFMSYNIDVSGIYLSPIFSLFIDSTIQKTSQEYIRGINTKKKQLEQLKIGMSQQNHWRMMNLILLHFWDIGKVLYCFNVLI